MAVTAIGIVNYRSIRDLHLPLAAVTVLLGANGCGKTNCYRAIRLLQAAATGRLSEAFSEEGGMDSVFWAGKRKHHEIVRCRVEVSEERYSYALACGVPTPRTYGYPPIASRFLLDPEVKEEDVTVRLDGVAKPVPLCSRRNDAVTLVDGEGRRHLLGDPLDPGESVLSQIGDPSRYGELTLLRTWLAGWRFYHQFRTDSASPLRQPCLALRSPVLASDGLNLPCALQTIIEMDQAQRLAEVVDEAFPGARLEIPGDDQNRLSLRWHQPDLHRPFTGAEISDGTLRFLCLAAALLTPRPPTVLVLNEPEGSLHPDLLPALATLIAEAAQRGQVILTTHSEVLAERLAASGDTLVHRLEKSAGETRIAGATAIKGRGRGR